ncbi:MAG: putative sulfoacetate transporter SauU [Syntrophaceae bacterium PtaU1.Bin231]|nr:MAG: putative sulfoacetate transporter SauU [Syntrophaceae bacterium PtaU1.Bin231]HOG16275.1 MFS transporter [Syntrophales bacterium]
MSDAAWLIWLCAGRACFSTIFVAYSASLALLKADWAMTAGQAGLVQSAFHIGTVVSLFSIGFLTDRFGAKRTYLSTSVAAALSALLFGSLAKDFSSALLLYGLAGLCSGGSYTPGLTLIAERFPTARRGWAMGLYLAASSLGYAVCLFASSALFPVGGWRTALIVTCSGPLLGACIGYGVLRGTPNVVHPASGGKIGLAAIAAVWKNRPAMLAVWAYTFHCWELMGLWGWLPAYLSAAAGGGSASVRAASLGVTLSGVSYLTSVAGNITAGYLCDRRGRTYVMLLMALTSLGCSFIFGWMIGLPLSLLLAVAMLYNFSAIGDSSVYSTALTELVPPSHLGAAYSLRSVLGFGAGAVSPWAFGAVLDLVRSLSLPSDVWAWGFAWTVVGIGALPGPLMSWRLRRMPESRQMGGGLG